MSAQTLGVSARGSGGGRTLEWLHGLPKLDRSRRRNQVTIYLAPTIMNNILRGYLSLRGGKSSR